MRRLHTCITADPCIGAAQTKKTFKTFKHIHITGNVHRTKHTCMCMLKRTGRVSLVLSVFIFFQPGHASTPKRPIRALSVILHCSYQLNCMSTSINVCVRHAISMCYMSQCCKSVGLCVRESVSVFFLCQLQCRLQSRFLRR